MDEVLSIRLVAHGGVVAARDLHDAGVSEQTVRTAVRRGELIRVRRAAYVDGQRYREATPEERYRLRAAAVLRTRRQDAASHHAALAVHALPLFGCNFGRLDTVGPVRATIVRRGLVVHPLAGPTMVVNGIRTVPVADALVQATATTGLKTGVVAADAALHLGRCTVDSLHEATKRLSSAAGSTALAKLADLVDPAAESPGESLTRVILRMAGLPVRSQVRIGDDNGRVLARVDLLVGEKVVVEFDGEVKYAGDGRESLYREKQREDWLRELGYEVVRVVWADLADPARLVARVQAALARAARRAS